LHETLLSARWNADIVAVIVGIINLGVGGKGDAVLAQRVHQGL
jgi:hypothetical protein